MTNSKLSLYHQSSKNSLPDSYLKFQLNPQTTAVLSVDYTQEAIIVPVESVTSMPNMPAYILGLMNWRSRIIWIIDLPKLFNLEGINHRIRQYNIIVVNVESMLLGLVVQEIKGTAKIMADNIHSPIGQVATSLVPYLCGCVDLKEEILLVLDAQNIVTYANARSE
jgi:positive phototaxis protein PixI